MPGKSYRKVLKIVGFATLMIVIFFAGFLSGGYRATESIKARHETARKFLLGGAEASLATGDLADAVMLSHKALAESPDLYQPYRALGDAYRKSGELETALLMYKLALINSWKSQDSDMLGIFDGPTLIELARKQIEENVDEIEGKL